MRAVISVVGKDTTGILHKVSGVCYKYGGNIDDVNQTVMESIFTMVMLVDIGGLTCEFSHFQDELTTLGKQESLVINTLHEDIFDAMHKI